MMWWRNFYGPTEGLHWLWVGIGMLVHVLFWIAVFYVIVRLIRSSSSPAQGHTSRHATLSVEEILKQRFAKGEIDRDQFQEMSEELKRQ